jgi:hypothetical protein
MKIRTRDLAIVMALFVVLQVALLASGLSGSLLPWGGPSAIVRLVSKLSAYTVALVLCIRIVAEYQQKVRLRFAWISMAAFSAVSVIRYLFDTQLIEAFCPGYWHGQLITVLREVPSAISLLFLAAGVIVMAIAFLRTGLGFSLRGIDVFAMACVFTFLLLALYLHNDMSNASRLQHWLPRAAQLASNIFFCISAAGAIVLLRVSKQMGGGQLAAAMICLILHIGLRAALVLLGPFESQLAFIPHIKFIESMLYDCAPWIFAMAAACRYQLAADATEQLAGWGLDLAPVSASGSTTPKK